MNKYLKLSVGVSALMLAVSAQAQQNPNDPQFIDDTNWEINNTNQRATGYQQGAEIGGMTGPGYNPNTLRPAGDGFGMHRATQDVDLDGNEIQNPSRIIGDGTMIIEGVGMPTGDAQAANKLYVDLRINAAVAAAEEELRQEFAAIIGGGGSGAGTGSGDGSGTGTGNGSGSGTGDGSGNGSGSGSGSGSGNGSGNGTGDGSDNGNGNGSGNGTNPIRNSCHDPANVRQIGTEAPCTGMLIVDRIALDDAIADRTFSIPGPDGNIYTFTATPYRIYTGQITDFSDLFYDPRNKIGMNDLRRTYFDESTFTNVVYPPNLSYWDTSSVTDMSGTFRDVNGFATVSLAGWNTSNVTTMQNMFLGVHTFNFSGLQNWDVSNVTDMSQMFALAASSRPNQFTTVTTLGISNWDTSSVTNMSGMFNLSSTFIDDLSSWNTSSVTDMSQMFSNAIKFKSDIGGWDTSNVTNMSGMFRNALSFNSYIGGWDVSNVTDMSEIFAGAELFSTDISFWDTSSVTDMSEMFRRASDFKQYIGDWDVSNVKNMRFMFSETNYNRTLSRWNTMNVESMSYMFDDANFRQDISEWCVSKIPDRPINFNTDRNGDQIYRSDHPVWGTCPRGEDAALGGSDTGGSGTGGSGLGGLFR